MCDELNQNDIPGVGHGPPARHDWKRQPTILLEPPVLLVLVVTSPLYQQNLPLFPLSSQIDNKTLLKILNFRL